MYVLILLMALTAHSRKLFPDRMPLSIDSFKSGIFEISAQHLAVVGKGIVSYTEVRVLGREQDTRRLGEHPAVSTSFGP